MLLLVLVYKYQWLAENPFSTLFVQLKAHFLFFSRCYVDDNNNNNNRNNDDDDDDDATMSCSKCFFSSVGLIDHLCWRQLRTKKN